MFLSVIDTIQLFDLVWVLTEGGPATPPRRMAVTMFQFGFKRYQVGYASAISVVMFVHQPRLRPGLPALRAAP